MSLVTNLTSNLVSGVTNNLIGGGAYLSGIAGILPNVLFEWDGTKTNSFNPAVDDQTIYNLADRDTYEFWTGIGDSTTNDPTFNSPDFEFDGTQRITLKANTSFINRIHKTNETDLEVTFIVPVFIPSGYTGSFFLFGSANATGESGFSARYNASNHAWAFHQHNGSSNAATLLQVNEANFGNWNLVTICIQKTSGTGGNFKFKLNEDAIVTGTLATFGATTADAGDALQFSGVAGSSLLPDGSKLTSGAMINAYLSDIEINSAGSYYATAHDRAVYITAPPIPTLDSVVSFIDAELDATLAESYAGTGQEMFNVIQSPNSGVAQSAYDAWLGEDGTVEATADPVFVGTAGDSGAYFNMNSNKIISLKSNTPLVEAFHEYQARDWSFVTAFRYSESSSFVIPISTGGTGVSGVEILADKDTLDFRINILNSGGRIVNTFTSIGIFTDQQDVLVGVAYTASTNTITGFSGGFTAGQSLTGAMSDNSGVLTSAGSTLRTIRATGGSGFGTNGRFYHLSVYNGAISSANFVSIKNLLDTRHAKTY